MKVNVRRIVPMLALLLFVLFLFWFVQREEITYNEQGGTSYIRYEKAKVLEVIREDLDEDASIKGLYRGSQELKLKLLSGEHKGEIHVVTNYLSTMYNVLGKEGLTLIVSVDTASPSYYQVSVYSHYRAPLLYGLLLLLLAALWGIGGRKGLMSAIGLAFTFSAVIFLFIPMIYRGYSPIGASVMVVILTTCVTLLLLDGWTTKAWSAILGTSLGVMIAGTISSVAGLIARITGFNTEEAESLIGIANETGLQVQGLLFAAILIASLGAVMDVAISIASVVNELHAVNPKMTKKELFVSGLYVGRDMMGTMANTLILAFTGTSLPSLLLLYAYRVPFNQLMNMDLVTIEIIQGVAGSMAVIVTVPIVAFISSRIIPLFGVHQAAVKEKTP